MMKRLFTRIIAPHALLRDNRAVSTIEFAIIVPVFLMFLFGVLQAGVWLQSYNAVKSSAYDGARAVMVEFQKNNDLTDAQIQQVVIARATNTPYYLESDRLTVNIDRALSTRVTGATEIDVEIVYQLESFIPGIELPIKNVTYERPIFVVDPAGTGVTAL